MLLARRCWLSYFELVQGLIVSQSVQWFTIYFQDLVTYRRYDSINSQCCSSTKSSYQLARRESRSGYTFLQPSISSCCPAREYGLDVDSHWSIHTVPSSNYAEAQTLGTSSQHWFGSIIITNVGLVSCRGRMLGILPFRGLSSAPPCRWWRLERCCTSLRGGRSWGSVALAGEKETYSQLQTKFGLF